MTTLDSPDATQKAEVPGGSPEGLLLLASALDAQSRRDVSILARCGWRLPELGQQFTASNPQSSQ